MNNIKVNSIVVYKNPRPDEMFNGEPLRFVVTEINGDRCFMEPVTMPLSIKPVILAMLDELEEINEKSSDSL